MSNKLNNIINDNKDLLNALENKYRETLNSISQKADKTAPLLDKNLTNKTIRTGIEDIANSISELDIKYANLKQESGEITEEDIQQQAEYRQELGRLQQKLEGIVSYTQDEEISNPKTQEQYGVVQTILNEVGSELKENSEPINMAAAKDDIKSKNSDGNLNVIAGGLTAAAGAISMFGKENKLLIEIQAKLQAAITITNGLIKINEGLNTANSVKLGIVTNVTNVFTAATTRLAVGLGISTVAAKALMATLTLGLSAAIAGIIYLIDQYSSEQSKAEEATAKFNESVASTAGGAMSSFEKLRKEWELAGDSLEEKEELIQKNQDAYDKLGISINSVADADKLFNDNAEAFKESILLKAKAMATMDLAAEKYKEAIKKMLDAESRGNNPTFLDKTKAFISGMGLQEAGMFEEARKVSGKTFAEYASSAMNIEAENILKEIPNIFDQAFEYGAQSNKKRQEAGQGNNDNEKIIKKENKTSFKQREPKVDKTNDEAQKLADYQLKLTNSKNKAAFDARAVELDNQQKLLDIQEDGFDKQQEQANLNHQKEILSIERKAQELIEAKQKAERDEWDKENPNGSETPFSPQTKTIADLDSSDVSNLIASDVIALKTKEKAEADILKAMIEEYQGYADKYTSINAKFNNKLSDLEKARTPENSGEIDRAIEEAKYQQAEALKAVNEEFAQRDETFQAWVNQIANLGLKQLQDLLSQAQTELENAERSGASGKDLAIARAKVDTAKAKIREENTTTTPGERTIKEWQNLEKTLEEVSGSFKEIGDTVGGTTGKILSAAGEISSSTLTMISGIVNLSNTSATAMSGTAQAASASVHAVEKASVILAVISAALMIATKIASLFGGAGDGEFQKMKDQYGRLNEVWDQLINKKKEYLSLSYGDEARKVGEEAENLINKSIESNRILGKAYMSSQKNKGGKSWGVRQQGRIDSNDWNDLSAWKKNNNISDSAFNSATTGRMTGLFDLTAEQLEKLKSEAPTFWAKLETQTTDYLNNIIDGEKKIEDIHKAVQEQLTQVSFDNILDKFVDTLMKMDSSAEDFAEDFGEYLQRAILTSMVGTKFDERLEGWYTDFAKFMADKDSMSEEERKRKQEQLQSDWDKMSADAIKERDALKNVWGWDDKDTRKATEKGFATASQDSINDLTGIMTNIQGHTYQINGNVAGLYELSKTFAATYSETLGTCSSILQHTKNIDTNTQELYTMRTDMANIKEGINSLVTHGINLKK